MFSLSLPFFPLAVYFLFISASEIWLKAPRLFVDTRPHSTVKYSGSRRAGEHSADLNHKNTHKHTCTALNRSPTVPPFFVNRTEFRPILLKIKNGSANNHLLNFLCINWLNGSLEFKQTWCYIQISILVSRYFKESVGFLMNIMFSLN